MMPLARVGSERRTTDRTVDREAVGSKARSEHARQPELATALWNTGTLEPEC